MRCLTFRNPHEALPVLLDALFRTGKPCESRNGPVIKLEGPTTICFERPLERVVFWPERDANPFFHLMEALWMLAGRNDLEFVAHYAKRMADFSDDGATLNGAYGYRWRNHFGFDQLEWIIDELINHPNSRRAVLQMWDAGDYDGGDLVRSDLRISAQGGKDVPCNTQAYFSINSGRLDMTVCNRSNDLIWGMLGANAVHFSFLQEYLAGLIGVSVGCYYQFTNNLHGYLSTIGPLIALPIQQGLITPYGEYPGRDALATFPLNAGEDFEHDLEVLDTVPGDYRSLFFNAVVLPMQTAHSHYKAGRLDAAKKYCERIEAKDWRKACSEWIQRRIDRRLSKSLEIHSLPEGVL